jgi:hydroxymethylglutaryl-CoA reductase (NADPH)
MAATTAERRQPVPRDRDNGCYGAGNVRKFAEIVAATVLCGELSLGSAIVAEEWVEAHDLFGRNRP